MQIEPLPPEVIRAAVAIALAEDRAHEDITTLATVDPELHGTARFVAKETGVLSGLPVALATFHQLDDSVTMTEGLADGTPFERGHTIAVFAGPVRTLLQGERTALNFIQRMSGSATLARRFVDLVAGTNAVILDTRKTTPGLRDLEKYAVRCGGATNHRRDLAVMAMIKDNHREALARRGWTLADGIDAIRKLTPGAPVEVEIDGLADLEAALEASPEWVLLDNMAPELLRRAVEQTAGRAKLEASGGVNIDTVRAIAETGVDAISVGALTHSARALDIGMDLLF